MSRHLVVLAMPVAASGQPDAAKPVPLPPDHQPFMSGVASFSCANCLFYDEVAHACASEDYQAYYGTSLLPPGDPTQMCSDWFAQDDRP